MGTQMKRTEFVVTAESDWGVERGVNLALKAIEKGHADGEQTIPKHGVHVKWRSFDVTVPTDVTVGSIVSDAAPAPDPATFTNPEPQIPQAPSTIINVSKMDIEEARGVVGTAGTVEELDVIEDDETHGERFPGGRKGVLKYISQRRKELEVAAADRAAKAEAAQAVKSVK